MFRKISISRLRFINIFVFVVLEFKVFQFNSFFIFSVFNIMNLMYIIVEIIFEIKSSIEINKKFS